MGHEVGGYHDRTDWPKLGPSLLISTCLILAIRTAKWSARYDAKIEQRGARERRWIMPSILPAQSSLSFSQKKEALFPQRKEPWYQANDEDIPK